MPGTMDADTPVSFQDAPDAPVDLAGRLT